METLEIVGTGGDRSNTFNISTTAAIICAAAGAKVTKHGNRAASSKCGTADCLEALGVNLQQDPDKVIDELDTCGIAFLFAQKYHTAMGSLFYFFPAVFVNIFGSGGQESYAEILPLARRLMHVLAFAILFDGTGIVFADALRGAGDTKFQMVMSTLLSAFVYVPLAWAAVHYTHSVLYAWCAYGVYVTLYCICFFTRFRLGRWKKINILRE